MPKTEKPKEITLPKTLRGIVRICPVGEMTGIFVTIAKLERYAKLIGSRYIDAVIPLDGNKQPLPKYCPDCHGKSENMDMDNVAYWETETGSHGFCCATCGKVFQWG